MDAIHNKLTSNINKSHIEKLQSIGFDGYIIIRETNVVVKYLCAWGNDAASEVLTEARQLLVENYFQTPSLALVMPWPSRISGRAPSGVKPYNFQLNYFYAKLNLVFCAICKKFYRVINLNLVLYRNIL